MLKFIIITALLIYLFIRFSNFIFKIMFSVLGGGDPRSREKKRTKPKDGNVEVEFGPEQKNGKNGKTRYDEGEYVEYEEIK